MNKYSTWSDARINYHIAHLLGCKMVVEPVDMDLPWLNLYPPNDDVRRIKETNVTWGGMETRRQFWSWGLWANDANMALSLLNDITVITFSRIVNDPPYQWYLQFAYYPAREVVGFETHVFAQSFARAICECWLLWKDQSQR